MGFTTVQWCIIAYVLMSCIVMDAVKPQNDPDSPIMSCVLCFIVGGAIFIFAVILGIIKLLTGKDFFEK